MLFVSQHARGSKKGLRAFASVAMSVRDMLVELQVCSIEIAAQLAVSHALLIKMQKVLQEVKDAVDPPAVVSKTSGSQAQVFQNFEKLGVDFDCLGKKRENAAETEDEREHKRLKAVYQKRGHTTTLPLGSAWDPTIPADDAVALHGVTVKEEVAEAMEPTFVTS